MEKKINIRGLFLRNFVIELIKNTLPKTSEDYRAKENFEIISNEKIEELQSIEPSINEMLPSLTAPIESISSKESGLIQSMSDKEIPPIETIFTKGQITSSLPMITPVISRERLIKKIGAPKINSAPTAKAMQTTPLTPIAYPEGLSKLNFLIRDPIITEIECRGPDKNILVKKAGNIQQTKLILKEKEINEILNEVSIKTKIPIIGGTFKAALGNIIVTAVISEILGPRFIIQKRSPFRSLVNV